MSFLLVQKAGARRRLKESPWRHLRRNFEVFKLYRARGENPGQELASVRVPHAQVAKGLDGQKIGSSSPIRRRLSFQIKQLKARDTANPMQQILEALKFPGKDAI